MKCVILGCMAARCWAFLVLKLSVVLGTLPLVLLEWTSDLLNAGMMRLRGKEKPAFTSEIIVPNVDWEIVFGVDHLDNIANSTACCGLRS